MYLLQWLKTSCSKLQLRVDINEDKLQELFSAYGTVVSCKAGSSRLLRIPRLGPSRTDVCHQVLPGEGRPDRAAMIRFASVDEAAWIVERVIPACSETTRSGCMQ